MVHASVIAKLVCVAKASLLRPCSGGSILCWSPKLHRGCATSCRNRLTSSIRATSPGIASVIDRICRASESPVGGTLLQQNSFLVHKRLHRHFAAEALLEEPEQSPEQERHERGAEAAAALADRQASHGQASTAARAARALSVAHSRRETILDDSMHPIRPADLPRAVWTVLLRLRGAGHEGYVVGGAVRDLLLGLKPKDFDIVTTATPLQVKRLFGSCRIVGKRFPIAHVRADGLLLEVSSFCTRADRSRIPPDAAALLPRRPPKKQPQRAKGGKREGSGGGGSKSAAEQQQAPAPTWAAARAENAAARDFTVNAILLDPFAVLLFDPAGGARDVAARALRTVGPAAESFREDPARVLRAVRLSARCGLSIDRATGKALAAAAPLLLGLPGGRLQMEAHALFGYGAAAASLQSLWRHDLLPTLAPVVAERFARLRVPRSGRVEPASEPILDLLRGLDSRVAPQQPVEWTVWAAVMAAPFVSDAVSEAQLVSGTPAAARRLRRRPKGAEDEGPKGGAGEEDASNAAADCPRCHSRKAQAKPLAAFRFEGADIAALRRQLVTRAVRDLVFPVKGEAGSGAADAKCIMPSAQWPRVASLLVDQVDALEGELPESACEDCKEWYAQVTERRRKEDWKLLAKVLEWPVQEWHRARPRLRAPPTESA